jgi:hypothetical protein
MATPVIIGEAGALHLAVNLGWKNFFVTGAASLKDAQAYVRSQRASHWNVQTDNRKHVTSVGHGRFKLKKGHRVISLAQAFCANADEHEHSVLVLDTGTDGYWVVGIANGQVVQGTDVLVDEANAQKVVNELLERWTNDTPRLYCNFESEWLPQAQALSWDDMRELAMRHVAQAELVPISATSATSKNILTVAAIVVILMAANEGWGRFSAYKAKKAAADAAANAPKPISQAEAWAQGLKTWQEKTRVGLPDDLSKLFAAIGAVPTDIVGWEIRSGKCGRQLEAWICTVAYERRHESRATTRDLLQAMPAGWRASWGAIDKASLSFTVIGSAEKPDPYALPPAAQLSLPALSFAQHHSQAFNGIDIGAAAAVPLELPKQPDGKPTLVDVSQMKPVPVVLPVKAAGPLRSFALYEGLPVSWNSFSMEFGRNFTVNGDASNAFVHVFEAKGEIYATRD